MDTFANGYALEIGQVRTIVDLGGIAVLYAHLIQCGELRVRRELEAVQNVLQNQYVQYKQSRESIDLINYKYHDLKHQIADRKYCNDDHCCGKIFFKADVQLSIFWKMLLQ